MMQTMTEFNGLAFLLWFAQLPAGPVVFGGIFALMIFRWTLRKFGF